MTTVIFDVESTGQGRLTKFYHLGGSFHKGWKMMYFSLEDWYVPVPPSILTVAKLSFTSEGGKFQVVPVIPFLSNLSCKKLKPFTPIVRLVIF